MGVTWDARERSVNRCKHHPALMLRSNPRLQRPALRAAAHPPTR